MKKEQVAHVTLHVMEIVGVVVIIRAIMKNIGMMLYSLVIYFRRIKNANNRPRN